MERLASGFRVSLDGGRTVHTRRVLLATGTLLQGAMPAASAGAMAGYMMNHLLNMETALQGALAFHPEAFPSDEGWGSERGLRLAPLLRVRSGCHPVLKPSPA